MALPGCTILCAGLRHHGLCTTQFGMSTGVVLVHLMFRWPCCWDFGDVASDITKRHNLTANSPSSDSYDISTWDRLTCIVKLSPPPLTPHQTKQIRWQSTLQLALWVFLVSDKDSHWSISLSSRQSLALYSHPLERIIFEDSPISSTGWGIGFMCLQRKKLFLKLSTACVLLDSMC